MPRFALPHCKTWLLASSLLFASACGQAPQEQKPARTVEDVPHLPVTTGQVAAPPEARPAAVVRAAPVLKDVIETTPSYIIGISYPQVAARYPPLAKAVQAYAESVRADLMQALAALDGKKPAWPYDLSLQFRSLVETSRVVAVAADGSSYTGGAHGMPLVERFVWLPQQQQMLAAEQLIPVAADWKPVSDYCREQLLTELSQQLAGEQVDTDARASLLRSGSAMIDQGTRPKARNFSRFEPVMNADGSIRALRFVFPPYQVGPYSEGTHTVEVPARVLSPLVAPVYRPLFRAG